MHFALAEWLNTLPILMGVLAGSTIFTTGYSIGLLIVERKNTHRRNQNRHPRHQILNHH